VNASTHTKRFESHPLVRPLAQCPECGSEQLQPVIEFATDEVHFLCRSCRQCWHLELGYVNRMPPHTCHACSHASRRKDAEDYSEATV
jgi:hypothetical protein